MPESIEDRAKRMPPNELYDASRGKGGPTGYDDRLASAEVWSEVATAELKRRGYATGAAASAPALQVEAGVSADAQFIAARASADTGRIIKHLWIIFVLLPVVLGLLFAILTAK